VGKVEMWGATRIRSYVGCSKTRIRFLESQRSEAEMSVWCCSDRSRV